jgi:hypothetical protein
LNLESEIKKEENIYKDTELRLKKDEKRAEDHNKEIHNLTVEIELLRNDRDKEKLALNSIREQIDRQSEVDQESMRKIDEIKKKEAQQSAENEKLRTNIIAQKEEYNFLMEQREQRDR